MTPTTPSWGFGDGVTSTLQHPTHTYVLPGTYTVTLTVAGPDGTDNEVKADYVIVYSCHAQVASNPIITYTTVQAAVDAATDGDTVKIAGYCTGVSIRAGVTQTVYISKTLAMAGGYTTTNWVEPDPVGNPTMLDAEGQGRVLCITGDISPTIEGLRITGGDATGLGGWSQNDAGG